MTKGLQYERILIKLSGECCGAPKVGGVDPAACASVADEVLPVVKLGAQVAIVVGGGNIIRGRDLSGGDIQRTTADAMGMLATVVNALAIRDTFAARGAEARVMSAVEMTGVCEPFDRERAIEHLDSGRVVIFAGGTGHPFFTTDTCAALRAGQIGAGALVKATKVDGVFDADPVTDPNAKKYDRLTYDKVLSDRLGVMDMTSVLLCMENHIPVIVLKLSKTGNLLAAVRGDKVGTLVSE